MLNICVVIPAYNHGATIREVAAACLDYCPNILVINDGSTDATAVNLADLPIELINLPKNMGKGNAIKSAAATAGKMGFSHIVTLDADGQHRPKDLPAFFEAISKNPNDIIIGARDFSVPNVPASSKFGRAFSEFWMFVQTGTRVSDMQSGFRAYPLAILNNIKCQSNRYDFEIEILARAAWAGFAIREIPIIAYYPPGRERVSHFKAFLDNFRISVLNTKLTMRALTPISFNPRALDVEGGLGLTKPIQSLKRLAHSSSPAKLGRSAAWSLLISSIPVIGLNTIALLFTINWRKLDRLCALLFVPLTWLPLIPGVCVLAGYRLLHGQWLTEFSLRTLGEEAGDRFVEWLLGSLIVAPLLALLAGALVYVGARTLGGNK